MAEENNTPTPEPEPEPENVSTLEPENNPIPESKNPQTNTYQSIIEQQQAQINALLEQTTALNNQIINMVNSGAQFNDNKPVEPAQLVAPKALSDDEDYSLESLAKEIGKRK